MTNYCRCFYRASLEVHGGHHRYCTGLFISLSICLSDAGVVSNDCIRRQTLYIVVILFFSPNAITTISVALHQEDC